LADRAVRQPAEGREHCLLSHHHGNDLDYTP